jgi:hypothetical protein
MSAPDLIPRDEVRAVLIGWDPASRPDDVNSPFWMAEVEPKAGGRVYLCERIGDGCGWVWASVLAVYRWRVLVEVPSAGPPGSKLVKGDRFTIDRECIHVCLRDEADLAALAAWHRVQQEARVAHRSAA